MRIVSVFGRKGSGKTTVIEALIRELVRRGYTVGSIKDIHFEGFAIDTPGSNTDRHKRAGANPVTALGLRETDIMFGNRLTLREILAFYRQDFVVFEGVREAGVPAVLTVRDEGDIDGQITGDVFAISGVGAKESRGYDGCVVIDAVEDVEGFVDLVELKAGVYPNV